MRIVVRYKTFWENNLEKKWNLEWNYNDHLKYVPDFCTEQEIKQFWIADQAKFNTYDGELLLLTKFTIDEINESIIFHVGNMNFSTLRYLISKNYPFSSVGRVLGVQCMIYNPLTQKILIGKRSLDSIYCPGIYTLPGGMLEKGDLKNTPIKAFLREIIEEINLTINPSFKLLAFLQEQYDRSLIVLFTSNFNENNEKDLSKYQPIARGEEWENDLFWISIEDLQKIKSEKLMEGLSYLKDQYIRVKSILLDQ
ncbi:MAG: NUDIX hydrolase [Candidatus Thorarchaeota archaeon]